MEDTQSGHSLADERYILKFRAGNGFTVVLEFGSLERMDANRKRIEEAGLQCERLAGFNLNFDQSDLYMDMRSPVCTTQFDLEDWL